MGQRIGERLSTLRGSEERTEENDDDSICAIQGPMTHGSHGFRRSMHGPGLTRTAQGRSGAFGVPSTDRQSPIEALLRRPRSHRRYDGYRCGAIARSASVMDVDGRGRRSLVSAAATDDGDCFDLRWEEAMAAMQVPQRTLSPRDDIQIVTGPDSHQETRGAQGVPQATNGRPRARRWHGLATAVVEFLPRILMIIALALAIFSRLHFGSDGSRKRQ